jgi:hypothetical protein
LSNIGEAETPAPKAPPQIILFEGILAYKQHNKNKPVIDNPQTTPNRILVFIDKMFLK